MNKQQGKTVKKARCIRDLKVLAWKIKTIDEKIPYYTLAFPKEWYEKMNSWYQILLGRTQITLPIDSLNAALQALPINLIDIKSRIWRDHYEWLTFSEPVDEQVIFTIFKSWFTVQFIYHKNASTEIKEKMIKEFETFSSEDLKICVQELDLSLYSQKENGTVDVPGISYSLLPNYIMAYIAQNNIPIEIRGKQYYFYMAYDKNNKKELISTPLEGSSGKYFSLGVSLKLVNMPGVKEPIVKLETKVRRWANGKYSDSIDRKGRTTVFVKYNEQDNMLHKQGTTLGTEKIKYNYDESKYIWDLRTKEILENAKLVYLPDMQEILAESEQYLKEDRPYSLFITYNKDNKFQHGVKTGITMCEKNEIFNEITRKISFLYPIEKESLSKITNCRLQKNDLADGKNKHLVNYLEVVNQYYKNNEITIEILWQRENTFKAIIDWFKGKLNDSQDSMWQEDNSGNIQLLFKSVKVNFISIYSGDLVAPMEEYKQKVASVKQYISNMKQHVLSVVEILPPDEKSYRGGKDPKSAIRKGLYECDRINQFINIEEELNEHKIENIVGELFRQLGICIEAPKTKGLKGIPEELSIVGLLLLSSNEHDNKDAVEMPIAIATKTSDKKVLVKTPLSDQWIDYYDAILTLGKRGYELHEKKPKERKLSTQQVSKFYQQVLYDMQDEEAIILVDVSNRMNSLLPEFQNQNISVNGINCEHKKIRIIRVKSNDEILDYVGEGKANEIEDFLTGVWKITDDIFYSIERKGTTYTKVISSKAKVDYTSKFIKYPKILEIILVKLLPEDNKESYVYFTHALRQMNSMYKDFTKKPFILHLGEKLQEVLEVQG